MTDKAAKSLIDLIFEVGGGAPGEGERRRSAVIQTAADAIAVSRSTVYRWIATGSVRESADVRLFADALAAIRPVTADDYRILTCDGVEVQS